MDGKSIAIYGKTVQDTYIPFLRRTLVAISARGVVLDCEREFADFLRAYLGADVPIRRRFGMSDPFADDTILLLSVGGDGTFLDTVPYVRDSGLPVLGINTGRLGFLASVSVEEADGLVDYICGGHYETESRDVLKLKVTGENFPGFAYGLNEVGVLKTDRASMLRIHASIDGVYLTTYWADGLIIASATGSTAYSLSGGGPIVSPVCRNMILTPICPHNLTMRTLVVPTSAVVRLKVEARSGDFMLSLDSRLERLGDGCELEITGGEFSVHVVRVPGHDYYATLRDKLGWGEDVRNSKSKA